MLGVATMIVAQRDGGLYREMQNRIHGIISDVVVESRNFSGMRDADMHIEQFAPWRAIPSNRWTPTVVVPAMFSFQYGSQWMTGPCN